MWQCGIQSRKIVCGQARRTEPLHFNLLSTSPEFFIDQNPQKQSDVGPLAIRPGRKPQCWFSHDASLTYNCFSLKKKKKKKKKKKR